MTPITGPSVDLTHGPIEVSANRRFLQHTDGTPFFWLGDTAWELFHRLTREEAEVFLEKRRTQGFTVIQAVALAEFEGLRAPNRYGDLPLIDLDPTRPNEGYFKHVDWVIDLAASKGSVHRPPANLGRQSGARQMGWPGGAQRAERTGLRRMAGPTAMPIGPTSSGCWVATGPQCAIPLRGTRIIGRYGGPWLRVSTPRPTARH